MEGYWTGLDWIGLRHQSMPPRKKGRRIKEERRENAEEHHVVCGPGIC